MTFFRYAPHFCLWLVGSTGGKQARADSRHSPSLLPFLFIMSFFFSLRKSQHLSVIL